MSTRKIKICEKPQIYNVNGTKVCIYKQNNKTLIVSSIIGTGVCKETKETAGINHLLEHVLTNAWKKCNYTKCATYLSDRGINYNAHTTDDHMLYWAAGMLEDREDIINYIIDITNNPVILPKNMNDEKKAVKTEILGYANSKTAELKNQFSHIFFKNVGLQYTQDWKVQLENLKKFSVNDLIDWYKKYYTDISYFIIGDIDTKTTLKLLREKIPQAPKIVDKDNFKTTFSLENKVVYVHNNSAKQVNILLAFPNKITYNDKNFVFIKIVCSILKNILFKKLRTELNLVYGVSVKPSSIKYGSTIIISVNANKDKAEMVIKYVLYFLDHYKKINCTENEVSSVKKTYKYSFNNNIGNNSNERIFNQYKNQILYLQSFDSKKLKSVCEIKKEIDSISPDKFRELLNIFLDFKTCLLCYQSTKALLLK